MDGIGRVVSGTKTEQLPKDLKPPTTIKGTPAGAVENCAGTMPSRIAPVAMCENSHFHENMTASVTIFVYSNEYHKYPYSTLVLRGGNEAY